MKLILESSGQVFEVEVTGRGNCISVAIEGNPRSCILNLELKPQDNGHYLVRYENRTVEALVQRNGSQLKVWVNGDGFEFSTYDPRELPPSTGGSAGPLAEQEIRSAMPGKVVAIAVEPGQMVAAGQPLLVLEAMKMQNEVRAPIAARIETVWVKVGDVVNPGDPLLKLEGLVEETGQAQS